MNHQVSKATLEKMQKYNPVDYLIHNSKPTEIDQLYLNNTPIIDKKKSLAFVLLGPTGSGKDTVMIPLINNNKISIAVTATTRKPREGESEDAYIWMREMRKDENVNEYYINLVDEYELIESDVHNNNLYGMPKQSLLNASKKGKPILIRTELNGLKTFKKSLEADFNIISVFLVPESYQQISQRIQNRDNIEIRLVKALKEVSLAPKLVDYYILNTEDKVDIENGIKNLQITFEKLIDKYSKI